jgi:hypothetical protein
MLAGDDRPLQADLVCRCWALPVPRGARNGNSRAPPPTECAPPRVSAPIGVLQHRPAGVCRHVRVGSQHSRRAEDRQTRDRAPLASCWLPGLLALESSIAGRATEYPSRDPRPHLQDEHCKIRFGVRLASTANCSSSASMLGKPPLQSTWPRPGAHPRRAGRPSSLIMPMASARWTCSSCRRSRFGCYTGF